MAGKAGDGHVGFFEGQFFDIFRGPEKNAKVAWDRAQRASRRAEKLADKAGIALPDEDAPETVAVVSPKGQAVAAADVSRLTRQIRRLRQSGQALAEGLREQAETNQAQGEAIEALQGELEQLREGAQRLVQALRARFQQEQRGSQRLALAVLSVVQAFVSVINVTDTVQSPAAKALAEGLKAIAISDVVEGSQETWIKVGALLAECAAYYDPRAGLMSILTADGSALTGDGLTDEERAALKALTDYATAHGLV